MEDFIKTRLTSVAEHDASWADAGLAATQIHLLLHVGDEAL